MENFRNITIGRILNMSTLLVKLTACVSLIFVLITGLSANDGVEAQSDIPVSLLNVSPDGIHIAVAGRQVEDQSSVSGYRFPIDIIYFATGATAHTINEPSYPVNSVGFSPDSRYLIFDTSYGNVDIADISTSQIVRTLRPGGVVEANGATWNPSDNQVAYFAGRFIFIVDGLSGEAIKTLSDSGVSGLIGAIDWSNDGSKLASTTYLRSTDRMMIQLWNTDDGVLLTNFEGRDGLSLQWSSDSLYLASNELGGITIYDEAGEQHRFLSTESDLAVDQVAWSPDGSKIAAGGHARLWVWDVGTGQLIETIAMPDSVNSLVWMPDSAHLIHNGGPEGIYVDGIPLEQAIPTYTNTTTAPLR